jgi:hypothetical protein
MHVHLLSHWGIPQKDIAARHISRLVWADSCLLRQPLQRVWSQTRQFRIFMPLYGYAPGQTHDRILFSNGPGFWPS